MEELTHTRHNHLIDPNLTIWGWEIPVYLFLGGFVAGMMILSGVIYLRRRNQPGATVVFILPYISLILLSLGMLALFIDLEHKLYTWRLYLTFKPLSPMSWGAWILLLVYPVLILKILINPFFLFRDVAPISKFYKFLNATADRKNFIAYANIVIGAMLGAYTGILLSALGARPLWNSGILWLLFLVSGLSGAAAFIHLIAPDKGEREMMAKTDNYLLAGELFVIAFFLISLLSSSAVHIQAATILLSGAYAPSFWGFVIIAGIIIPLIIQSLAVSHKVKHTPIAPLMVIAGGLILRFVIVYAGQLSGY